MNKKEIVTPVILIGLGLVFILVSFAVFISNGKSKKWIARKMKIGGLILTLTAVANFQSCVSCYDMPALPNTITIYPNTENGIEMILDTGNVIKGMIYERQGENFSFAIHNSNNQIVQSDLLIPTDGAFDNYSEEFKIEIDTNISVGKYALKLFDVDTATQSNAIPKQEIILVIKANSNE